MKNLNIVDFMRENNLPFTSFKQRECVKKFVKDDLGRPLDANEKGKLDSVNKQFNRNFNIFLHSKTSWMENKIPIPFPRIPTSRAPTVRVVRRIKSFSSTSHWTKNRRMQKLKETYLSDELLHSLIMSEGSHKNVKKVRWPIAGARAMNVG